MENNYSRRERLKNLLAWAVISQVLVLADQYAKHLAVSHLKGKEPFVIWDGVFELLYSENRGAAFGMLQGRQGFFFLVGLVVMAGAIYMMWKMPGWRSSRYHALKICVILITAGAWGNMIDRMSQGFVVDFLYFKLINFPIFNVADIYVTTAAAALFLLICFYYKDEELEIFRLKKEKKD